MIERRQVVLAAAYQAHPERFVRSAPELLAIPREVWINKPPENKTQVNSTWECLKPGVSPFFPAPGPFHASLRNTAECRTKFPLIRSHAAVLYVIDNERARTIRSFAPGGARAGFQHVKKASGSIEPYRAMPLLAISNTLNANGLATSAPKFWGNSCFEVLAGVISW